MKNLKDYFTGFGGAISGKSLMVYKQQHVLCFIEDGILEVYEYDVLIFTGTYGVRSDGVYANFEDFNAWNIVSIFNVKEDYVYGQEQVARSQIEAEVADIDIDSFLFREEFLERVQQIIDSKFLVNPVKWEIYVDIVRRLSK